MSYPRTYPPSGGGGLNSADWNAALAILEGFSATGNFSSPYRFLVTSDGTDYYGSTVSQTIYGGPSDTGGVDGGDGVAVLQACLDGLTAGRTSKEKVCVRCSLSVAATAIDVPSHTILDLSGSKITGTQATSTGELIAVRGGVGTEDHDIDILGGYLTEDGSGYHNNGVGITSAQDVFVFGVTGEDIDYDLVGAQVNVERVTIQNCFSRGTRRYGFSFMDDVIDSQILGCIANGDTSKGIYVSVGANPVSNIIVSNNIVVGAQHGIQLQGTYIYAVNNIVRGCSRNGYYLYDATNVTITGGASTGNTWYGFASAGASSSFRVHNLDLNTNTLGAVSISAGDSDYEFEGCLGFITKNRGSSTGTGAQQTIAHGLAGIPDYVWFSNVEDGANPYLSAASDATNIYVTAVAGKDYVWKAEYIP